MFLELCLRNDSHSHLTQGFLFLLTHLLKEHHLETGKPEISKPPSIIHTAEILGVYVVVLFHLDTFNLMIQIGMEATELSQH